MSAKAEARRLLGEPLDEANMSYRDMAHQNRQLRRVCAELIGVRDTREAFRADSPCFGSMLVPVAEVER